MRRALLALVGVVGCTSPNAQYCDQATPCTDPDRPFCDVNGAYTASGGVKSSCIPDPYLCQTGATCPSSVPACSVGGHCVECVASTDCKTAAAPACDTGENHCVQCMASSDCSGTTPVCETSPHTCRACRLDSECETGVCEASTGRCVAEGNIFYLTPTGSGSSCTKTSPCQSLNTAVVLVVGGKKYLHLAPGTYTESVTVTDRTLIVAGNHATLTAPSDGSNAMTIGGTSDVALRDLTIAGGTGNGIVCTATALALTGVTVRDVSPTGKAATAGKTAISVDSCKLTIVRSAILRNFNAIAAAATAVSIQQSMVDSNTANGIVLASSSFDITNNFITRNGRVGSPDYALHVVSDPPAGAAGVFQFNTVAGNSSNASVVLCSNPTPLTFDSNIVYGNTGATQVSGNCVWVYSDIYPLIAGTGNVNADPHFLAADDFHLATNSFLRHAGNPGTTVTVDYDGDSRPAAQADIGADQVP